MESATDDSNLDSRTFELSCKRGLPEFESGQDFISFDSSDEPIETSHKRAKISHEPTNKGDTAEEVPSHDPVTLHIERSTNTEAEVSQQPPIVAQNTYAPPVPSWNQNVQSGLRTSFGSKSKALPSGGVDVGRNVSNDTNVSMPDSPNLEVDKTSANDKNVVMVDSPSLQVDKTSGITHSSTNAFFGNGKHETVEEPSILPLQSSMESEGPINTGHEVPDSTAEVSGAPDGGSTTFTTEDPEGEAQTLQGAELGHNQSDVKESVISPAVQLFSNQGLAHSAQEVALKHPGPIYAPDTGTVSYKPKSMSERLELPEVLVDNKHLSLQELTFAAFVPVFLATNLKGPLSGIGRHKVIIEGFRTYLEVYYPNDEENKALKEELINTSFMDSAKTIMDTTRNDIIKAQAAKRKEMERPQTEEQKRQKKRERQLRIQEQRRERQMQILNSQPLSNNEEVATTSNMGSQGPVLSQSADYYKLSPDDAHVTNEEAAAMSGILTNVVSDEAPMIKTEHDESDVDISNDVQAEQNDPAMKIEQEVADIDIPDIVQAKQEDEPAAMTSASPNRGLSEEDEMDMDEMDIDDEVLGALQKYFPSTPVAELSSRCLMCAETGHRVLSCPHLTCSTCGERLTHASSACPDNQRCTKCRQRGHQKQQCPEKLAATKSEASGCDLCQSKAHVESGCHLIWRSFQPKPEEVRKVRGVPIYCYSCGASGHYGPECNLRKREILSGGLTWSSTNMQRFVDVTSQDEAICAPYVSQPCANISIKGHAKGKAKKKAKGPPSAVSDDDDGRCIRSKINKKPVNPPQPMHINQPNSFQPINGNRNTQWNPKPYSHNPQPPTGPSRPAHGRALRSTGVPPTVPRAHKRQMRQDKKKNKQ